MALGIVCGRGADIVKSWNIPEAAGNPLFGLPQLPKQALPPEPYLHLKWFEEKDAELFFGRGREIRALHDMVTSPDHAPVILFSGQTGVGKSSMLAAGVIPRLRASFKVLYARCETDLDLLGSLAMALQVDQPDLAKTEEIYEAWRDREYSSGKPLLLVLDQLEEVFSNHNHEWVIESLKAFFRALNELFRDRSHRLQGKLILGFRKEWLPELETSCREARQHFTKFFLKRLDREGTIEAIEGVVRSEYLQRYYGLKIDSGLAAKICEDLLDDQDSPLAPTLQILLTKMWDKAYEENPHEPRIKKSDYDKLKKEGILLSDFLDEQLLELKKWNPEASESGLVLDVLAQHTLAQMEMASTRTEAYLEKRYAHKKELIPQLLKECQKRYLLVPLKIKQKDEIHSATRLAHDTLAPLIRYRHRNSALPGQRAIRILENRAVDWEDGKFGAPLSETNLTIAEAGQYGMRARTDDEERLIDASIDARAKRQQRRYWLQVATVTAFALIAITSFIAWTKNNELRRLIDEFEVVNDTLERTTYRLYSTLEDLREALRIARENERRAKDAEALAKEEQKKAEAAEALARDEQRKAEAAEALAIAEQKKAEAAEALAIAEQKKAEAAEALAKAETKRAIEAESLAKVNELIAVLERDTANQQRMRTLGLALANKSMLLLESSSPEERKEGILLAQRAHFYNDRGDGEFKKEIYDALRLALIEINGTTTFSQAKLGYADCSSDLQDEIGGGPFPINPPHKDWVRAVAFSPNGRWVVSGGSEGVVYASSSSSPQANPRDVFEKGRNVVRDIEFDQIGEYLATVFEGGLLNLYRIDRNVGDCANLGNNIRMFATYKVYDSNEVEDLVHDMAFYPLFEDIDTGRMLAVAREGQIDVLEILASNSKITIRKEISVAADSNHTIRTLTFSSDGNWLIGGDQDGFVHVWSWPELEPAHDRKQAHRLEIRSIASSASGLIATGSVDSYIRLFQLTEDGALVENSQRSTLYGHAGPVNAVAFDRDGSHLASGSADQSVRLWTVARVRDEAPIIMADHSSWIEAVSFAQNGMLISGSADRTVKAWRTDIDQMARLICQFAQPNEMPEETWKRYVPAFDYEKSCVPSPLRTADTDTASPSVQRSSSINE